MPQWTSQYALAVPFLPDRLLPPECKQTSSGVVAQMASASDSSPEGCPFDSGQPHECVFAHLLCVCFVGGGTEGTIQVALLPDAAWG